MKKITQILLMAMIFLCQAQFAVAQNVSFVKGVVTEVNGKSLIGATVELFKTGDSVLLRSTVTNEKGIYEFRNLPEGSYYLATSYIGFMEDRGDIFNLVASQNYYCDTIRLSPKQKQLGTVVLNSKKTGFIETKIDRIILNIENSPVAAGASVFEVLEKSPGIYSDKNGNLSMQGKSGLQVLVDGRPTYMSNSDLTNLLKNMQSNEVQTIEIITNPSSKYDASGNAGIINIKTKKSKKYGTNGALTGGISYGNDPKANAGFNLNNRSEKLNIFGNYNYNYDRNSRTLAIDREAIRNGVATYFVQDGTQYNEGNSHLYKFGADYNIGKKGILGFLINGNENFQNQHAVNTTLMGRHAGLADSSLNADNNFKQRFRNNSYNLNFKSTLNGKGVELAVDADYSKYSSRVNSLFRNYYYTSTMENLKNPLLAKNNTNSNITIKSLKADFTNPVSTSLKIEAGAKVTMIRSDNDLSYATLNGINWQNDVSKSNHFIYDEDVMAAYVNASKEWKSTSVQAGLRAEYSDTKGNSLTDNKIVKRNYLDFFPSLFVNQKLSSTDNIGLSYSRRIQRPDYESLNPFIYIIDEYTYQRGNPFLNPEYSQSFSLTYLLKNKYMAQAGYTVTNDMIAEVILPDTANNALYQTNKNLDRERIYRLTLSVPLQIAKWWKVNNNFNGIKMLFNTPDLEGQQLNASQFFVILNSNHSFKINRNTKAELNCKYTSPMVYGTFKLQSEFTLDAGISKSILNKKADIKIGITDILNTKSQKVSSVYPGVNYALRQKFETRVVRLSFIYRFGNNNVKASRDKKSGLEEEQSRLKSLQ